MLLRNLGVGIEPRRSQSRCAASAGCGCAARLFLQSSALLLAGAESGTAIMRQAARLKATFLHKSAQVSSHCGCGAAIDPLGHGLCTIMGPGLPVWREKLWYQMHIDAHIWDLLRARRPLPQSVFCGFVGLRCCWRMALTSPCYAIAREQHCSGGGAPITRSEQLSPLCSKGAPASRLNMQAE